MPVKYRYIIQQKAPGRDIVGTKAWNLYRIVGQVRIPEFVVISVDAFRYFKQHGSMPKKLMQEVGNVVDVVFNRKPIAVRSSGTAEDTKGHSYAGMYATVLNVSGIDAVVDAVQTVWRSNDSRRVKSYRSVNALTPGEMAVILQKQLNPDVSGVMITDGGKKDVIIECCRGLGDKLVSGKITPTRYRIRGKKILEQSGNDILSPEMCIELCETGQKIQKVSGSSQDIEWAFQDGVLFTLQARPCTITITARKKKCTAWCNANVRETIPDPISPMGYSFFEKYWIPDIMLNTFGFPLTREQYEQYPPVERVLGHLYWNINNTAAYGKSIEPILKITGAGTAVDPQLGKAMESIDISAMPKLVSTRKMLVFSVAAMLRMSFFLVKTFFLFRQARKAVDQICDEIDDLIRDMHPTADFSQGVQNVRQWVQVISGRISRRYFSGILVSVFYLSMLSKILEWRMGKKGEAIARMTTYSLLDKTGEMVLAIRALASYVHNKLSSVDNAALDKLYRKDPVFKKKYDTFIVEFGHRGPGEFDIASKTWYEDKMLVYNMLQHPPKAIHVTERTDRIKNILNILPPFEKFCAKIFLPRIKTLTPIRETAKHYVFKIMRMVKDQLLLLEKQLIDKGYLEESRDIYFLCLDELKAVRDNVLLKKQIRKLLHDRKAEWQKYLTMKIPDIVYEDGEYVFLSTQKQDDLTGIPLSYGRVRGRTRIIHTFADACILQKGDIMVTHHTDPGWTPYFSVVSGVIIEVGGVICHAAMVARELGLPAIVLPGAMSSIPDNAEIELDADTGTITLL